MRIPAQPKPFALVPYQFRLGRNHALGDTAVLGSIEYKNSSARSHSSNNVGILRLVSRLINLAWMINFLLDDEFDRSLITI